MGNPGSYVSFLVRIWQECTGGAADRPAAWHAEVENIQSGEIRKLNSPDELLAFVRELAEQLPGPGCRPLTDIH